MGLRLGVVVAILATGCGRLGFGDSAAVDSGSGSGSGDGGGLDAPARVCATDADCGPCQSCGGDLTCHTEAVTDLYLGHRSTCFIGSGGARWCSGVLSQFPPGEFPTRLAGDGGWTSLALGWLDYFGYQAGETIEWQDNTTFEYSADTSWADISLNEGNYCLRHAAGDATCNDTAVAGTWTTVVGGDDAICGIRSDGSLWCWGYDSMNELGGSNPEGTVIASPTQVGTETSWLAVGNGLALTCAMRTDHTIWCMGDPMATGTNGVDTMGVPTEISADTDWTFLNVKFGHACAGKPDGSVYCWGTYHGYANILPGQATVLVPTAMAGTFDRFEMGGHHYCAIPTGGTQWSCWGWNDGGQLGNGDTAPRDSPGAPFCSALP